MISNAPPFSVVVAAPVVLAEIGAAAQFVLKRRCFFVTFLGALASFAVMMEVRSNSMRPAVCSFVAVFIGALRWG